MYGTLIICVYSAEVLDMGNSYAFNNVSLKFKALVDTPGEGPSKSHISPASYNSGRFPKWNDEFTFNLTGETQLNIDVYDSNPQNTKSVKFILKLVWLCLSKFQR